VSVPGNIIWLIFGGFFTGLGYIIGGLALCLTIVGIPFGLQSIKLGAATMTPFGMEIVPSENGGGALRPLFNIIWLVLFGSRFADRGGASGRGRVAGHHHHRAALCPPTSEIAPPGAVPLWARTALAVSAGAARRPRPRSAPRCQSTRASSYSAALGRATQPP